MYEQIRRLEIAMIRRRTWTGGQHRSVLEHPDLREPARRLVWLGFDDRAEQGVSFRIADDGRPTDSAGRLVDIDAPHIAVAHPLQLAAELPCWLAEFSDRALCQPFPQLSREVHVLTERERASTSLDRFANHMVPTASLLRLREFGWRLGGSVDGVHDHLFRPVGGGLQVLLQLDDGIAAGEPIEEGEHVIEAVELGSAPPSPWWRRCGDTAFGVLDPIDASEVLRELATVFD